MSTKNNKPATGGATIQNAVVTLQTGQAIGDGFNTLPKDPKFPIDGQGTFLPSVGQSILSGLAFFGSALSLKETWDSIKDLYYAENKNYEKVTNVAINLFRTVTISLLFSSLATGAVYALPILLPVSAGLGALWGLFHVGKKAYQAYKANKAGDKTERNRLLKEMVPHVFSTVINGLGLGLTLIFNNVISTLTKADNLLKEGIKNFNLKDILAAGSMTQSASRMFAAAKPLAYTLAAALTLGTVSSLSTNAKQNFAETADAILHPVRSLHKFGNAVVDKIQETGKFIKKTYGLGIALVPVITALEITSVAVSAAIHLTQFVAAGTIKLIGCLASPIASTLKNLFGWGKTAAVKHEPYQVPAGSSEASVRIGFQDENNRKALAQEKQAQEEKSLQAKEQQYRTDVELHISYNTLKNEVTKQKEHLMQAGNDKKHIAKRYLISSIENKLGNSFKDYNLQKNISEMEAQSKVISPLVKQSFFRDTSRTQRIVDLAKSLDTKISAARSAPAA